LESCSEGHYLWLCLPVFSLCFLVVVSRFQALTQGLLSILN
jgi:hypothetical protein